MRQREAKSTLKCMSLTRKNSMEVLKYHRGSYRGKLHFQHPFSNSVCFGIFLHPSA